VTLFRFFVIIVGNILFSADFGVLMKIAVVLGAFELPMMAFSTSAQCCDYIGSQVHLHNRMVKTGDVDAAGSSAG